MSCFICSTFVPGLACSGDSSHLCGNSRFHGKLVLTCTWKKSQKCIGISGFTRLSLHMRAVFWQPWWLPACFQILCFIFTVIDDVTFVCVVSFLIWSSMLVVLVLIVLKSSVCWRRQCWRYSLYLCIYRIPYPENPLSSPSERSGLHRAPEIRELSFL